MPNVSSHNEKGGKNTSSGHGSQGMGGQPDDNPRDLAGGGTGREFSDLGGGTGQVPGAFGGTADVVGGGTGSSQTTGPQGDRDATGDVDNAIRKSREGDKG